ncbi:SbcC/MukB-like Walker B domain-containing protein [Eubacterium barkeri]|uniref:Uncharacterized protein YPO0396 n=1 Tax=Eubacterium barkeri TaxID=1528 RepID=A0A1H3ERZ4_EUBBA|nr:SbcC/MukB-like Walker B domain-containing protein [Eubacterium barkeri]SDX81395.1 Uncharacterized protein YPO0396 [Eubacterium barkeri]
MIKLKRIRLVNWYGYNQVTVPIGNFTLIAGKNRNGKSVLLDAIKYALYGDTVFNKSTEKSGERTVLSYTRGLLDATANTYMRPADKVPNVYSHIVLEMEEVDLGKNFILGTVINTDSGNNCTPRRYVIENQILEGMNHTYQENGLLIPYNSEGLQKIYGLKMMDVNEGLLKFMQRTGLRLSKQQLVAFRRKLRSIMSYNPSAKIDQFIRESVLEKKIVDFSKLVEAKHNIDRLKENFENIDTEINELEKIIKLFEEHQRAQRTIFADEVKQAYQRSLSCAETIEKTKCAMEVAKKQIKDDESKIETIERRNKILGKKINEAKDARDALDCAKAILAAKEALENAREDKERLEKEKDALILFETQTSELMAWFCNEDQVVLEQSVLASLTTDQFTKIQKESSIVAFSKRIEAYRDGITGTITRIQDSLEENQRGQTRYQKIIDDCDAKKTTFSQIPDYVALKDEINREFQRQKIQSEARFACEYVIGLHDETWRDAIESYLGRRRYTILVDPEFYNIADDVLNRSKNRYAHLFNTKLLMKKKITLKEDSVVQFIKTKNPVAKQYFDYQLGRIHATTKDQVRNYENAMSKEGRVSVAMDSFFLHFDTIRFYCLGQETIELNRIKAVKALEKLNTEYEEYQENLAREKSKQEYLGSSIELFDVHRYNFDACQEYTNAQKIYSARKAELNALEEAQKNNMEYMELSQRVGDLEKEQAALDSERANVYDDKSKMDTMYETNRKENDKASEDINIYKEKLKKLKIQNNVEYMKATDDYDRYVANGKKGTGGPLKDRNRAERTLKEATNNLTSGQASYNASRTVENQLPITEHSIGDYQARKSRIWMDDRQEIQTKLKKQTDRYEAIFKNEFVLTVLKSCESARDDLKRINVELANLAFESSYSFEVKYVRDGSDYEKILEYAKYLKTREKLGITSEQIIGGINASNPEDRDEVLEKEIKGIINRIVESNDEEWIKRYADYRNYMMYEILLTNDVLTRAKLSKQSGYNSGAEVQIPYMLILLSALLMIYNEKNSSTRLVFIDEPFAKMDPTNVKIMLKFMKEQNLQMIFCAPDKTELIGNECEVVLPVLRTQPDLMEIGIIEIHKEV